MLVVHMDSGLGNQMLDYAEFLAIQKSNPDKECFIENIVYDIPCVDGMQAIWNGYELEKIFGIQLPNIKDKFEPEAWNRVLKSVEDSKFWEEGWNFTPHIIEALKNEGISLKNYGKPAAFSREDSDKLKDKARFALTKFFRTDFGYFIKRIMRKFLSKVVIRKENKTVSIFREYPDDSFVGHWLRLKHKGFGIEKIEAELREAFRFPDITDEKNLEILRQIKGSNAVAIHARRSDLLSLNGHCYEHGYFKRAVRYIKKHVRDPHFYFFTDEYSVGWCEEHEEIFGLDFHRDKVSFITWNKGGNSYIDMQLMAECKHNIFTESTFGFWGAYLNKNPDKITCAPDVTIIATNSF